MPDKRKTIAIQITAIALAALAAFGVITYARGRASSPADEDPYVSDVPADTPDLPADETDLPDLPTGTEPPPVTGPAEPSFPGYDEELAAVPEVTDGAVSGMKVYRGLYDPESCVLAAVSKEGGYADGYSLRDGPVRRVESAEAGNGATVCTETYETGPLPVLTPYYGYLLYDDGYTVRLLDPRGRVLLRDVSEYTPTGYRDLSGHPLFKRGDSYYYYYDGVNSTPGTVASDRITPEDIYGFPADVIPEAYNNVDSFSEITPSLPDAAGMVECTVDENYFNGLAIPSSYENRNDSGIFRFCEHRVIRNVTNQAQINAREAEIAAYDAGIAAGTVDPSTPRPQPIDPTYTEEDQGFFWGYVDRNGDYVLTPRYERAYDFSSEGLAVVSDPDAPGKGRLCVIDANGTVRINAYKKVFYDVELGNVKVRDGHYLPDTFGPENAGMLGFDRGLLRVRRRLLFASGGVRSETDALVNESGGIFNIPGGYTLVGYSDGIALLEKNGKYGYMDHTGVWILQPDLTYAEPFCEGLAAAGYADGHIGMIDRKGNAVLPQVFDFVSSCSDGVVAAFSAGHGWTVYNKLSRLTYEEPVNPILMIKKRLLAQAAYDAFIAG